MVTDVNPHINGLKIPFVIDSQPNSPLKQQFGYFLHYDCLVCLMTLIKVFGANSNSSYVYRGFVSMGMQRYSHQYRICSSISNVPVGNAISK